MAVEVSPLGAQYAGDVLLVLDQHLVVGTVALSHPGGSTLQTFHPPLPSLQEVRRATHQLVAFVQIEHIEVFANFDL